MKDKILSINFETQTAPIIKEVRGEEYIEYGTENWKNLYPQFLIDLYYNSSTHAAVINSTAEMIAGEELVIESEGESLEMYVKLKKFFRNVNSKETLHQVIKKIAFDFKLQGAYAIHCIYNQEKTEIVELYHVPVERVRAGKPNMLGVVDCYYISADWSNIRENPPYKIDAFNTKNRTSASQLLYTGSYSPNMDVYHTPDYLAACNWALVDQKVAEFHLNNIENGFSGSYFISFANGIPTQEERYQIEQSLVEKFTGAKNSGKFVLTFSDDKTRTPEITPISVSDADKQYLALQELLVQNILTGHRVTSKTLMGIDSTNGFSSNTDELINAANFFQNTVVRPFQINILDTLQKIFSVNNVDLNVEFIQLKPITVQFDSKTIREVMTQDEIRESLGLPALKENEEVVDEKMDFAKVGSMVTDGQELPLYETKEEAEAEAERIGCKGSHIHTQDGKEYYMPCENHDQIKDLELSHKHMFEAFLESMEDIPEDWELIEEEVVDGEHQDFDFEKTLNEEVNKKIKLASTGTARPNARSSQDGVNKSYNDYYKVRYVYAEDEFLVNETGQERPFCVKMMEKSKVYRKEDILKMSDMVVNDYYYSDRQGRNIGWGANGDLKYSIWLADQHKDCCNSLKTNKLKLYKGGGNCHHFWLRRIYKTSLRNAKAKINDSQLIGYTKARSEGFTAEKNDNLVARPPKRMKNNGFLPSNTKE